MVRCASGDASTSSRATLTLASRSTIGPSSLVRMGSGTKLQSSDLRGANVPHSDKSMLRGGARNGFVNWMMEQVCGRIVKGSAWRSLLQEYTAGWGTLDEQGAAMA